MVWVDNYADYVEFLVNLQSISNLNDYGTTEVMDFYPGFAEHGDALNETQEPRMILTCTCTLDHNSLGERKFSLSTDIQLMITRVLEPLKTPWVGDLFLL